MWNIRKITLPAGTLAGDRPLLRAAQLADHRRAQDILALARQEAEAITHQAQRQADALLAQALEDARAQARVCLAARERAFLQQADALLQDWRRQRHEWREALLPRAEQLLHQALAQLADALPPGARLHALLRQLLLAQGETEQATLWCHPDMAQQARAWLAARPHLAWRLDTRADQDSQSVLLATQYGALTLDWEQLLARLWGDDAPPVIRAKENSPADGTDNAPRLPNSTTLNKE